ncbi:O-antigen polysaccharide polymerase Wzy [Pleomorphomonas sp. PLEO]|uniref:O-antigen polysaccharide polymerase Wzy n=1 Tax=Pleomorphomonas sp. PLEO TaxID=3239306 RepID=UPI00351E92D8
MRIFYIVSMALCVIYGVYVVNLGDISSPETTYYLSLLCIFVQLASFMVWGAHTKSYFDILTLFLLSQALFLAGHQMLYVFGGIEAVGGMVNGLVNLDVANMAIFMILISLVTFGLGMVLAMHSASGKADPANVDFGRVEREAKALVHVGYILLAISIVPFINSLSWYSSVVGDGGYAAIYEPGNIQSTTVRISFILMELIVPAAIFLIASGRRKPAYVGALITLMYAGLNFYVGTRGHAIMPILAVAWTWHRRVSPIPKVWAATSGLIVLFVVFPIIAATRESNSADRYSVESLLTAFNSINNPAIQILDEMGRSGIRIVSWVYQIVPEARPFDLGKSYAIALSILVPHLGGGENLADASKLSLWITTMIRPEWAVTGGGFGFSYVGEAYLNFSWVGVVIVSAILGYALARGAIKVKNNHFPIAFAYWACICAIITFYPRSELQQIIRNIVWYGVGPLVMVKMYYRFVLKTKKT